MVLVAITCQGNERWKSGEENSTISHAVSEERQIATTITVTNGRVGRGFVVDVNGVAFSEYKSGEIVADSVVLEGWILKWKLARHYHERRHSSS